MTIAEVRRSLGRDKRMILVVLFGIPERISPTGLNEYCAVTDLIIFNMIQRHCQRFTEWDAYDNTGEVCKIFQGKLRQVLSVFKAMKGAIEVCTRVAYHFYFSDLEFRSFFIELARCLSAEIVAYDRGR